jgi:hypothetical protein
VLRPPRIRPTDQITPWFKFHHERMSFYFRHFKEKFSSYFKLHKVSASQFAILSSWLIPRIYFFAEKAKCAFQQNWVLTISDNSQQ